jgi:hypothetical protein
MGENGEKWGKNFSGWLAGAKPAQVQMNLPTRAELGNK